MEQGHGGKPTRLDMMSDGIIPLFVPSPLLFIYFVTILLIFREDSQVRTGISGLGSDRVENSEFDINVWIGVARGYSFVSQ